MELRQLKTFQTAARLSSFNRAATVLNYSRSAVSTQIRLLEEEFGVALFNRLGKRICLTEAGQMLMSYSQRMLDVEQETLARISGLEEPQGSISARVPQSISTYVLPSVLRKFQANFPKVGFDISTCAYETLIHELKTGIIDIAFLLAESIPFSDLRTEVLGFETLVVVSSPNHPLAKKSAVDIHDFAGQSILLPKHDCSYKMVFQRMLVEEKIEPATYIELNSIEAIKRCVFDGVGVAMLPIIACRQAIAQKTIAILPWPEEQLETAILMIWHKDKWISPILQVFMDTVRQTVNSTETGE